MKKSVALLLCLLVLVGCGIKLTSTQDHNLTRITNKSLLKSVLLANAPNRGWYETMKGGLTAQDAVNNSSTNTQVLGIDEGDTVKTNGEIIVNIQNNKVYIVSVETNKVIKIFNYEPAKDAKEVFWPTELYLTDTQLIIIGSTGSYGGGIGIRTDAIIGKSIWWGWGSQDTFIQVVDLTSLEVKASYELKGGYFTSRLSGKELIVIANQWQTIIYDEKNNPIVVEPTVTDLTKGSVTSSVDKGNAYILPNNQGNSFVNLLKIDLGLAKEPTLASYLGWIQTVYMNESNLIIAQSRYEYNETTQIGTTFTDLLRFDVNTLTLKAQGSVKGYLLNQFSLDIYQDVLRIALTNWDKVSTNRIVTLDMALTKLDSIENLAEKETIRSVRFIKDKGYVVTFENIDPLFVVDFSNPRDIAITGALKVPGFSTYLHLVSDHVIWGIAEDLIVKPIVQNGQTFNSVERFGVKISLFNVADPTHPLEVTHLNILGPSGSSEAQYNHKAIVLDDAQQLVYLPFSDYHYNSTVCKTGEKGDTICNYSYESGIKVLRISETDVKLVKTISVSNSYDQNTWINRCVFVDNKLYLMSNIGISVIDRTTFEKIGSITY